MAKTLYTRTPDSSQRVVDADLKISGSLTIPTISLDNEGEQLTGGIGIKAGVPSYFNGTAWVAIGSGLAGGAIYNATTSELSAATLNTTYPSATVGFEVICNSITGNPLIYKKGSGGWYSIPLGTL